MKTTLIAALLGLLAAPSLAFDGTDDVLTHRVLPGWIDAEGRHIAGLELSLAPGWKTYWRAPGDAGIPPQFDWSRAGNLDAAEVLWPAPKVFWQSGMRSVGYDNRIVLPLAVTPRRADKPIRLRGRMMLGVCAEVCIPATLKIDAVLAADAATRTPALVAAMAAQPYSAGEAGVRAATCSLRPATHGLQVTATITMPPSGQSEDAVIEASIPGIWVSEATTARQGDRLTVFAEMMMPSTDAPLVVDRSGIRITVIGSNYAVDVRGCDSP